MHNGGHVYEIRAVVELKAPLPRCEQVARDVLAGHLPSSASLVTGEATVTPSEDGVEVRFLVRVDTDEWHEADAVIVGIVNWCRGTRGVPGWRSDGPL